MAVALDLDNTLVSYDRLFHRLAVDKGFADASTPVEKNAVRDAVRASLGDETWQDLQAEVYGPRMSEARLIPGVDGFLRRAAALGRDVYIVSHKTEFASRDATGTSLRLAAMDWMRGKGFFDPEGFGLREDRVHFESTRAAKAARVTDLGCDVLVDDLPEVLAHPGLSAKLRKILFAPHGAPEGAPEGVEVYATWREITDHVLGS